MFRKFINWKKNIKPVQWHGLNVYFDPSFVSFEELWLLVSTLIIEHQEISLKKDLINENWRIQESNYSLIRSIEENNSDTFKEYISLAFLKKSNVCEKTRIIFQIHTENLSREFINKMTAIKGIYFAIYYNPYFKSWENRDYIDGYKFKGGLNVYFNKEIGIKMVDLSRRPGRYKVVDHFSFTGGSEYWISPQLLAVDQIKSIHDVKINVLESNNVTHVKLFDLPQYWKDSSQEKIALLRALLENDK